MGCANLPLSTYLPGPLYSMITSWVVVPECAVQNVFSLLCHHCMAHLLWRSVHVLIRPFSLLVVYLISSPGSSSSLLILKILIHLPSVVFSVTLFLILSCLLSECSILYIFHYDF